jgi:hypothetical protein
MKNQDKDLITKACEISINQINIDYEKRYMVLYSFYLEKDMFNSKINIKLENNHDENTPLTRTLSHYKPNKT